MIIFSYRSLSEEIEKNYTRISKKKKIQKEKKNNVKVPKGRPCLKNAADIDNF